MPQHAANTAAVCVVGDSVGHESSDTVSDRHYSASQLLAYRSSCEGDVDSCMDLCSYSLIRRPMQDIADALTTRVDGGSNEFAPDWDITFCAACLGIADTCHCGSIALCSTCALSWTLQPDSTSNDCLNLHSADWELIDEPLQAGLKTIRGRFPKIYQHLLEEDKASTGDISLVMLTGESQQQAIANITGCLVQGIHSSVSSDRARAVLDRCRNRVENTVNEGVCRMFRMVESQSTSSNNRLSCERPHPSRLKGITKRGMAQPRAKKK